MEIERIVKRVQQVLKKSHSTNISSSTMVEILTYSKKIFNDKKHIDIFKEIITTENVRGIYSRLAKVYNVKPQRIIQIEQSIIEKIFLVEAKTTFENIKSNEEKLNVDISKLGLNKKLTNFLEELHCCKIKDIFGLDIEYLKIICATRKINYEEIFERIKVLKITPPKTECGVKLIEELDMSPKAYKYIKENGICTNRELLRNINRLLSNPKLKESTKQQIKNLYERIKEELNETDINEDNINYDKKM